MSEKIIKKKKDENIENKRPEDITIEDIRKAREVLEKKIRDAEEIEEKENPRNIQALEEAQKSLEESTKLIIATINSLQYEVDRCILTEILVDAMITHLRATGFSKLGILRWSEDYQKDKIKKSFRKAMEMEQQKYLLSSYLKQVDNQKSENIPSYIR